jgi:acyl-CoA synthetase (AMP-forming)/AMP-acid ligase II
MLGRDARTLAAWLLEQGLQSGDVVSVQLPNRYETVVVAVAAGVVGAVVNPLLPSYRAHELVHVFSTAQPRVLFTPDRYRDFDHIELTTEVMRASGCEPLHVVVGAAPRGSIALDDVLHADPPAGLPAKPPGSDAVSEVIFTSGTEATPKAVMHTEDTANFSVRTAFDDLGMGSSDVVWMPSPLGHSTGFNYGMRMAVFHGLPLVLQDRWEPNTAIDLIRTEGCSYTLSATTFLQDLVDEASSRGVRLPSMRLFGCGGSPVPARLVEDAEGVGIRVLRLYGSTEVLVATWNRPDSTIVQRAHTDGVAMTNVEVGVRDEDGLPCAPGEPGEIFTRGPDTCVGFFDDEARTAATFDAGGWVRSGDLATIDADGYLTVVGRKKEIIIRGGINITPREIEDLLVRFPEVRQAAVVGLADQRLGERVCACVTLHQESSLDLNTVRERLRDAGLAPFKVPEDLRVVETIPMTASGKIQKHVLLQQIEKANA